MKSTTIKTLLHAVLIFIALLSPGAQAGVEITYIHNDALGTPIAGTDEQGNVKWRAHYQPYGEEVLGERQLFGVRTGYTGHREDPETGLTYMGARYYSPALGRFMGVDPAGVDASNIHGFNRYAYANNNPYRFIDPDGRVVETAVDIVSLGLSINLFKQDPSLVNGLGVAFDGLATVVPFLPGGFGIIKSLGNVADTAGDLKGADGLGNLLNSSKFDSFLRSKGRAPQFKNEGSAKSSFDQLRKDSGISSNDVVQRSNGVSTFRSDNRTFTLRSDSAKGNTVSVKTDDNPQQIIIRFGQE